MLIPFSISFGKETSNKPQLRLEIIDLEPVLTALLADGQGACIAPLVPVLYHYAMMPDLYNDAIQANDAIWRAVVKGAADIARADAEAIYMRRLAAEPTGWSTTELVLFTAAAFVVGAVAGGIAVGAIVGF